MNMLFGYPCCSSVVFTEVPYVRLLVNGAYILLWGIYQSYTLSNMKKGKVGNYYKNKE